MQALPGSEALVGGPLMCVVHDIAAEPLRLVYGPTCWTCNEVYMRVTDKKSFDYSGAENEAVLRGVDVMRQQPEVATDVLLNGTHAPGHPLPSFFTVVSRGHRVDFHAYSLSGDTNCLYAMTCIAAH